MTEIIPCPGCGRRLRLPEEALGRAVCCPSCATEFPAAPAAPPPKPLPRRERPGRRREDRDRDDYRRREPAPARPPWVLLTAVFLVVGLGVVGLASVPVVILLMRSVPVIPPPAVAAEAKEDDEPIPREPAGALPDRPPTPERVAAEVKPFFESLRDSLAAVNHQGTLAHFDPWRLADEVADVAALPPRKPEEGRALARRARAGLKTVLFGWVSFNAWTRFDVQSVRVAGVAEATVVVRHQGADGDAWYLRWWVTRQGGAWKAYDLEDLMMSLRASAVVAGTDPGTSRRNGLDRTFPVLREAVVRLTAHNDLDAAEKGLRELDNTDLPRSLDGARHLARARLLLRRGRYADSLTALDRAEARAPDMPGLHHLRALNLRVLKRYAEALKAIEAYHALVGDEATVCGQTGLILSWLDRFPEAAKAYRTSLDLKPGDGDVFLNFLRTLNGQSRVDDVAGRFARLDDPRARFDACAEDCEVREIPELGEILDAAVRKIDPGYPMADYYASLRAARAGRAAEAVALFRRTRPRLADPVKEVEYAGRFLKVMAKAGKAVEAYAAVPEGLEAFRLLAAELRATPYRSDGLRALVEAHGVRHPDDPVLTLYQAEALVREGHYAEADRTFAAALTRSPPAGAVESFRASRVTAAYHAGRATAALRAIGPQPETFRQLALLCLGDRDHAGLRALIDLHARDYPRATDLPRFRTRLMIREGRVDEGVALFKATVGAKLPDEERGVLVTEFLREMAAAGRVVDGYRAAPDARAAFRTLADELEDDGQGLRALVEAHRAGHAADPRLALYQADLLLEDGDVARAVGVLAAALPRAPADLRPALHSKWVHAMHRAGRDVSAYIEGGRLGEDFLRLAGLLASAKKADDLDALVRERRRDAPADPEVEFNAARVACLRRQPAEAGALLRQALAAQKLDYRRNYYVSVFLADLAGVGLALPGYRAAPDPVRAFETLAATLLARKNAADLSALLAEYAPGHADDPLAQYYSGELDLTRGETARAEGLFAAALGRVAPKDRWRVRGGLLRARVKNGKAALTLRELHAEAGVFEELANLCVGGKDAGQLRALLDARRPDGPPPPADWVWELELCRLQGDWEGVLKLLAGGRDLFAGPRYRWKADGYRVRALVNLKRPAEAVAAAEAAARGTSGDKLLVILAHAATGNVAATTAAAERLRPPGYLLTRCYDDADLGPLLRAEEFRPFREKFPPPKVEKSADDDPDD